jgi:O-antigen/teichoic acid export membrane protein
MVRANCILKNAEPKRIENPDGVDCGPMAMSDGITLSSDRNLRSLRERVFHAGRWALASHVLGQAIRFGTNLLMTRLLVPEMFGVMAIANMVMIGLALFSDLGLRQNVVQSPRGNDPAFLNTVWAAQIVRGFMIGAFAACGGLILALANQFGIVPETSAYAMEVLPYVVAALGIGAVVSGFDSTKAFEASRHLEIGRVTQIDLLAQVAGVAVMLLCALFMRSVWVLVAGGIATSVIRMALTHMWLTGVRNRFQWDSVAFREIFHFGKWIFLSSILTYFGSASDMMILGGLVSAKVLGVYSIAILLLNAIEQIVMKLAGNVAFPALSEVARERRSNLGTTLYKFHLPMAAFSYGFAGLLACAAPAIVGLLYDARYADAGWMLQILALALVAVPYRLHAMSLLSLGQPRRHTYLMAIRLAAILVTVPAGFHLGGMQGVVWGIVASYFTSIPASLFFASRNELVDLRKELLPLPVFALGWLAGAAIIWVIG